MERLNGGNPGKCTPLIPCGTKIKTICFILLLCNVHFPQARCLKIIFLLEQPKVRIFKYSSQITHSYFCKNLFGLKDR